MSIQRVITKIKREKTIETNQVMLTSEDKIKSNIKRQKTIETRVKHALNL